MKYIRELIITVLVCVVIYFVYRDFFSRPTSDTPNARIIELEAQNRAKTDSLAWVLDSMRIYRIMGDTWYNEAQRIAKQKIVIRTIFNNEKARIDSLPADSLSLLFAQRYRTGHAN